MCDYRLLPDKWCFGTLNLSCWLSHSCYSGRSDHANKSNLRTYLLAATDWKSYILWSLIKRPCLRFNQFVGLSLASSNHVRVSRIRLTRQCHSLNTECQTLCAVRFRLEVMIPMEHDIQLKTWSWNMILCFTNSFLGIEKVASVVAVFCLFFQVQIWCQ